MPLTHMTSVVLDIYSIIICLILLLRVWGNAAGQKNLKRIFQWMCFFNIGTLLGDIPNWTCEGLRYGWNRPMLWGGCLLLYLSGILLLLAYTKYVICYLSPKTTVPKSLFGAVGTIAAIYCFCVILSHNNGMFYYIDSGNVYHRGDWYALSQAMVVVILVIDTAIIFVYRKYLCRKELVAFGGYIILPIAAVLVQFFFYGLSLTYTASTVALLIIFIDIQSEQELLIEQMEKKLLQSRMSLLLGQIRPHFLYNSLTAIAGLCTSDARRAKEELVNFAFYLRTNMVSMGKEGMIPFQEEMEHTRQYLSMEKLRFGERLNLIYWLDPVDFLIPPLTLQPIVENAVRYGIMKRAEGGTVTITTEETKEEWRVIVEDDGPGFDTEDMSLCDGVHHVGIYNVRQRLKLLCGGALELKGTKEGVRAVIRLPKGDRGYEYDCRR